METRFFPGLKNPSSSLLSLSNSAKKQCGKPRPREVWNGDSRKSHILGVVGGGRKRALSPPQVFFLPAAKPSVPRTVEVVVVVVVGRGISLSEYNLAAYCIRYFGFINSLQGEILNSKGFYLTLVLRILFGVGSSSFDEVVIHLKIYGIPPSAKI